MSGLGVPGALAFEDVALLEPPVFFLVVPPDLRLFLFVDSGPLPALRLAAVVAFEPAGAWAC